MNEENKLWNYLGVEPYALFNIVQTEIMENPETRVDSTRSLCTFYSLIVKDKQEQIQLRFELTVNFVIGTQTIIVFQKQNNSWNNQFQITYRRNGESNITTFGYRPVDLAMFRRWIEMQTG